MKLTIYTIDPTCNIEINTCDGCFEEMHLIDGDPRLPRIIFDYVINVVKYQNPTYEKIIRQNHGLYEKYERWLRLPPPRPNIRTMEAICGMPF